MLNAEKFCTAGVIRVRVFCQSTGPIIGIRELTPLTLICLVVSEEMFKTFGGQRTEACLNSKLTSEPSAPVS